jgi:hypothetical protein
MMRKISLTAAFFLCLAGLMVAQAPPQMPKPGPEHKRLGYFAGTWQLEGDMKPGPFGPGGKFTGMDHNDWMDGGFFLVSHSDFKSAMGNGTGLAVFGYDPEKKVYTYHAFNSMGEAENSEGAVEGDTWTWTSNETMAGKAMKARFTVKETSPTAYNFKFEMAPEAGEFSTIMEGKASKTK